MDKSKYYEFLKKGYILTKHTCKKCGNILLKNPNTGLKFCPHCNYEETIDEYLDKIKYDLIKNLEKEKDIKNIYVILKSLYLIEKIKGKK